MRIRSKHIWLSVAIGFAIGIGVVVYLFLGPHEVPESVPLSTEPGRSASSVPSSTKRLPKLPSPDLTPGSPADVDSQAPTDRNATSLADKSHRVSDKARALLTTPLDGTTFRTALDILEDPDETIESRLLPFGRTAYRAHALSELV